MPTTIVNPEPAPVSATPNEPVVVSTAAEPTAQTVNREDVYKRYYEQNNPSATETVVAAPVTETVVSTSTTAAAEPPIDQRLSELEQRITLNVERLLKAASPVPVATTTSTEAAPTNWLDYIRQGKFDEGEKVLAQSVAKQIEASLTTRTLEAVRVENELTSFLTDLRTKNQDLVDLEDLIGLNAKRTLDTAMTEGKVKTPEDYITQYKAAVTTAVDEARKIVQKFRAAGHTEALTTKTQVLSATTIPPNNVDANRAPTTPAGPEIETGESYLQKRIAAQMARKGFAPQ